MIKWFNMYRFAMTLRPEDNHNYGNQTIDISGLIIANDIHEVKEKLSKRIGIDVDKTICHPSINPICNEDFEDNILFTGFSQLNKSGEGE